MINLREFKTHESAEDIKRTEAVQIKLHKLTGNVRNVYSNIVGSSFGNLGACTLKSETIANNLNISRSTVTRCVKKLKDLHVIEVINGTKMNGIKGANIYAVIFLNQDEPSSEPSKMSQRVTHETPRATTVTHENSTNESLSFNLCSNNSVINNVVNNVAAPAASDDLKQLLRDVYKPYDSQSERDFSELCRIGFGRLKQFMKLYNLPYLQIKEIVLNCMRQLVKKTDVRNPFAMYSKMIERQVKQLFEKWIEPVKGTANSLQAKTKEYVPEWFDKRNEEREKNYHVVPSTVDSVDDFEKKRNEILAKLGGY